MQYGTNVALRKLLLVVCGAEECEHNAVGAKRRLYNVRRVALLLLVVKVGEVLTRGVDVLREVVVSTVRDAPKLAPAKREQELDVGGSLRVEAKLLGSMVAKTHLVLLDAEGKEPVAAERAPVLEPLKVGAGLAEELKLHLFELAGTEREVAGRDLVAEALADLADTEGNLLAARALNVFEVYKDTLSGLGAKINGVLRILGNALEGLEHQVELTNIGEVVLTAGRARNVVVLDERLHLLLGKCINRLRKRDALLRRKILDQLVRAEALVALLAVHQRIGKSAQMARRNPRLRVHEDGAVNTYVVGILLDEFLPPCLLYVVLEFHAEITVIPGVCQTAVNLGARVYKASRLRECYNLVHSFFHSVAPRFFCYTPIY